IRTTCELPNGLRRLSPDAELTLFRVFQESLTNIHRHSQSEVAHIHLGLDGDEAVLEVKDEGKGMPFGPAIAPDRLGVGIRGMYERVRQLGGTLDITSSRQGTKATAKVPVSPPQDDQA